MCKKLISVILAVSLLNLTGCYSTELLTSSEIEILEKDDPDNIMVKTKSFQRYYFARTDYYIKNDTLFGNEKASFGKDLIFERKIPLSYIESIEYEYLNGTATAAVGLGVAVSAAAIGLYIYFAVGMSGSQK